VPNRLELLVVDVPNNEDEAKAGAVFGNKDGELLAGNAETPVCPNIVVLVDDVNGLELATGVLLNEVLNSDALVEPFLANGLFDENGFGVVWLNRLLVVKVFGGVDDGKVGVTVGVPEGFGPPVNPNIKNLIHILQHLYGSNRSSNIVTIITINKGSIE
jgi:hypothetical protein